jgi:hypothetical protein
MVKKLGVSIGDQLLPEQEVIINNSFEGSKISDDGEDISVKDIFSVLIPRNNSNDDSDDEYQDE